MLQHNGNELENQLKVKHKGQETSGTQVDKSGRCKHRWLQKQTISFVCAGQAVGGAGINKNYETAAKCPRTHSGIPKYYKSTDVQVLVMREPGSPDQ